MTVPAVLLPSSLLFPFTYATPIRLFILSNLLMQDRCFSVRNHLCPPNLLAQRASLLTTPVLTIRFASSPSLTGGEGMLYEGLYDYTSAIARIVRAGSARAGDLAP
jgi:hypothetical protein